MTTTRAPSAASKRAVARPIPPVAPVTRQTRPWRPRSTAASVQTVTTLLLVARTGETDWNRDHRWQGHSDTPLNETGRAPQARERSPTAARPADRIYSSDLARARETAEILAARLGVPVVLDERLRERGFGAWEGLTMDEIEERFAADLARWRPREGRGRRRRRRASRLRRAGGRLPG